MSFNGIRRILWKTKLLRMPLHNLPREIECAFQAGLHNISQRKGKNLLDWDGNPIDTSRLDKTIEFTLPWKFLTAGEGASPTQYSVMAEFTNWFVEFARRRNQIIVPTVNFRDWNSLPPRLSSRRISWHSRSNVAGELHLKIGSYPRHVSIDQSGYSGWASFSGSKDYLNEDSVASKAHFESLAEKIVRRRSSKYTQPTEEGGKIGSGYIFFAMQVPRDTVAQLAKIDTVSLLKELAGLSAHLPRTIVVKRHPKCKNRRVTRVIRKVQRKTSIIFSDGNIHDLIRNSAVVITVNSGVGAEALLHRKPVITTGGADYESATCRVDSTEKLRQILSAFDPGTFEPKIEQFIKAYSQKYMVEIGDSEALKLHPAVIDFLDP